jgi:hypothetical protein
MPTIRETLDLEDWVITVYAALDDPEAPGAEAGLVTRDGKLVPRPGPPPKTRPEIYPPWLAQNPIETKELSIVSPELALMERMRR